MEQRRYRVTAFLSSTLHGC